MHLEVNFSINRRLHIKLTREIQPGFTREVLMHIEGAMWPDGFSKMVNLKRVVEAVDAVGKILETKAVDWIEVIDDLTTDLWGGAGPDCRIVPV